MTDPKPNPLPVCPECGKTPVESTGEGGTNHAFWCCGLSVWRPTRAEAESAWRMYAGAAELSRALELLADSYEYTVVHELRPGRKALIGDAEYKRARAALAAVTGE